MTRWAAISGVALALAAAPAAAQVAPTVTVSGPASNPITDAIGVFTITAANFPPADLPLRLELQVSRNSDFSGALFADTTVSGQAVTIAIPRLLPGSGVLFWRAFALTARAGSVPSDITGPRAAPTQLQLLSPNNPAGQSLTTRRPVFTWRSAKIPPGLGVWDYELHVEETATGRTRFLVNTTDTTTTLVQDLESNESYRWRVIARERQINDSVTAISAASFVILSADAPLTTLLFNPFPSPFPLGAVASTCVWFDLSQPAEVTIEVRDLHGLFVKRIAPASGAGSTFAAGRYGRPTETATSGCDERFSWDGTDVRGHVVPPGTYLIRLHAGTQSYVQRVVFMGR